DGKIQHPTVAFDDEMDGAIAGHQLLWDEVVIESADRSTIEGSDNIPGSCSGNSCGTISFNFPDPDLIARSLHLDADRGNSPEPQINTGISKVCQKGDTQKRRPSWNTGSVH